MKLPFPRLYKKTRPRNLPLGVVLVVPFIVEIGILVGLTALWAHHYGQKAVQELATQLMDEVSDRVSEHLNHYLEKPAHLTQEYATQMNLGLLNWQNPVDIEKFFLTRLHSRNTTDYKVNALFWVSQSNQLVSVEQWSQNQWLVQRRSQDNHPLQRRLLTLGNGRSPLPQDFDSLTTSSRLPTNVAVAPQYRSASQRWYLHPLTSPERSSLALTYVRSTVLGTTQAKGSLGATINLDRVSDFLNNLNISDRGQVFIIEPSGNLVATSTEEQLIHRPPPTATPDSPQALIQSRLKATASQNPAISSAAEYLIDNQHLPSIQEKHQFQFTKDHKPYFLKVTPLNQPQGLNWLVVVVIPKGDLVTHLDRQYHTLFMGSGLALVGAIAIILLTARKITQPILRLSQASRDLMLGKTDMPMQEQTWIAELAVLAHSFNDMSDHLLRSLDQVSTALQESKEKFTTVFRTSPDPILITTYPSGEILEANPSFLRLTGYERQDVIGHTVVELGFWENLDRRNTFLEEVQRIGRLHNQELKTWTRTGDALTVLISSEMMEMEGQSCLLTVVKDITQRKQLEEALRQSEGILQDVLNSAAAAICHFHITATGEIFPLYFSSGTEQIFGYAPALLKSNPELWSSHVHPQDWRTIIEPNLRKIAQGRSLTSEYRYWHPTHQAWRWITSEIINRWDPTCDRWLVTSVEFDTTDRKQTDIALRISEEQCRLAFEMAQIGMDLTAADGRFLRVNPALCKMMGYSESEILQKRYIDLTYPDDLPQDYTVNHQILAGEVDALTFEKRFIHKDGHLVWAQVSLALVRDPDQMPLYWVAQVQDISHHKQVEHQAMTRDAQFRAVFELANTGMAIATLNGQILEANPALRRLWGYSKAELQTMAIEAMLCTYDRQRWSTLLRELSAAHMDHYQIKVHCITKDKQLLLAQMTTRLIDVAATANPQPPTQYLVIQVEALANLPLLCDLEPTHSAVRDN